MGAGCTSPVRRGGCGCPSPRSSPGSAGADCSNPSRSHHYRGCWNCFASIVGTAVAASRCSHHDRHDNHECDRFEHRCNIQQSIPADGRRGPGLASGGRPLATAYWWWRSRLVQRTTDRSRCCASWWSGSSRRGSAPCGRAWIAPLLRHFFVVVGRTWPLASPDRSRVAWWTARSRISTADRTSTTCRGCTVACTDQRSPCASGIASTCRSWWV